MCEAMKLLMREEMEEEMRQAQKKGEELGEARGEVRGEMRAKQETAFELYNRRMPLETIAEIIKVNLETVKGWFAETPTMAR